MRWDKEKEKEESLNPNYDGKQSQKSAVSFLN